MPTTGFRDQRTFAIDSSVPPRQPAARNLSVLHGARSMRNRWLAVAVLVVIRLTMAFQFQSVAGVPPLVGETFGVGLADSGCLIGLYFAPGIALALPGGAI